MFKPILVSVTLVATLATAVAQTSSRTKHHGTDDKPIYFNGDARQVIQPGSQPADKVSATSIGNVISLLFDSARISAQTASDPLTASWITTISVPTNATGQKITSYVQHVRGAVMKDANSRVCLIVSLGGKSFVKEYPYGTKASGNVTWTFMTPISTKGGARYDATIIALVERRDEKSAVLLDIDALDVEARTSKKVK
jgi:hypothetical protein